MEDSLAAFPMKPLQALKYAVKSIDFWVLPFFCNLRMLCHLSIVSRVLIFNLY